MYICSARTKILDNFHKTFPNGPKKFLLYQHLNIQLMIAYTFISNAVIACFYFLLSTVYTVYPLQYNSKNMDRQ